MNYSPSRVPAPVLSTAVAVLAVPVFSFAADIDLGYLQSAIDTIGVLIDQLIPVIIAIGLLFFVWGIVQFIAASGDEVAKEEGKRRMVWGIVALFVIVSVWGLVGLLNQLTGVDQGEGFTPPETGI